MAGAALIVHAPGRVNLIGEHTDYNEGFVMPIAIDRHTEVRATPRNDGRIRVSSQGFGAAVEFSLTSERPTAPESAGHERSWSRYVQAVAWSLLDAGYPLRGCDVAIRSTVPSGAGLSSSAALEVACGFAFLRLAGADPDLSELAAACQRAENLYVGTRCGIMDQYVACHAWAEHALLLDCRSLEHAQLPLRFSQSDTRIVVCNSMVKHSLADGEYNQRRAQCEAGVTDLARRGAKIGALRDLDMDAYDELCADMDPVLQRRCRHVIGENARVQSAARALGRGDAAAFGQLMYESHASLRDDYEVSCAELDLLVSLARPIEGVYGSRMTGGGFGGCTVNLVRTDAIGHFARSIAPAYEQAIGRAPQIFVCQASKGVHEQIPAESPR